MAVERFEYNGRKIVMESAADKPSLTIDGEVIPVIYSPDTDRYSATQHAPYTNHTSMLDLAKHVVDHVINLRHS